LRVASYGLRVAGCALRDAGCGLSPIVIPDEPVGEIRDPLRNRFLPYTVILEPYAIFVQCIEAVLYKWPITLSRTPSVR
jgi:hypothetical protein